MAAVQRMQLIRMGKLSKNDGIGCVSWLPGWHLRPDETGPSPAATVITYLLGKSNEAKDNISATDKVSRRTCRALGIAHQYLRSGHLRGFPDGTLEPRFGYQRQLAVLLLKVLGYSPAWEEVDEKAAELGLLSWDYNGNLAAPRGILAQAVYNATFQVSRADGTYIADEIFVDETGSGQEPTPANGGGSSSNPSTPSPGNGNVADDPEPKTGLLQSV